MACRSLLALLAVIAVPGGTFAKEPAERMIADFDSGAKPNNLGGDFGCWIKDPDDPMQGCIESFDPANRHGAKGYALRIIYSVDSAKPAYGGVWIRLQDFDASKLGQLAFRIKGDAAMGFTKVLKVELKDSRGQASHHYVRTVSDQWQDLAIPLNDFQGAADLARLKELVLVIEDTSATAKRGMIYLDDVRFAGRSAAQQRP